MLLSRLFYPAVAGTAAVTLVALMAARFPYWQIAPIVLVSTALVVVAAERIRPYAPEWRRDLGDARADRVHLLANLAVSQTSVLSYAALHRGGVLGAGWPTVWPFAVQAVIALVIVDLGLYAIHRASHGLGWLWRLHAIHHSPRRVYWMNGQRRHLLHEVIEGSPGLIVCALLGAPPTVVACAFALVTIHLMLQHANVNYRAGWLRYVFAVAEDHRWHHQRRWQDVQGNYGAVFSFWDRALGTTLAQSGNAPLDVGIDDEPDLPTTWAAQMAWPFRSKGSG